MNKKGLGKGLGALIPDMDDTDENILELPVNDIEPNLNQPRRLFDDEKIKQLSESIKEHGVIQPIIVKKEGTFHRIIAGERRWRAAREAGLKKIPVIIKDVSERQAMEMALIENLQREDLNPIEEAEAFHKIMNEFGMSQEEVAQKVGKSRPAIANSLRLLNLVQDIRKMVEQGKLSGGHARALLALEDKEKQKQAADLIIEKGLSVREAEKLVSTLTKKKSKKEAGRKIEHYTDIEEKLQGIFGTKVKLVQNNKRGKILIEYYSTEELTRLIDMIETISRQ